MQLKATYRDDELVRGCQNNEPRMQEALYKQHYRKMFGVCLRYAENRDDAADILQDGFVQVFRYIDSFRGGSLEGWIRRIMVNMAIAHYRKKARFQTSDIETAYEVKVDETALSAMSSQEILKIIQELPTGYRTIFNLYEIEGYTHPEISEMIGISVGTSKSQLSRAKEMLRNQLSVIS